MPNTASQTSPRRGTRWAWPGLIACVGLAAARAAEPSLPGAQPYLSKMGIVPGWAPWAGAALGAVACLLIVTIRSGRRFVVITGWAAVVMLTWTAVGVVFDAIRAFFRLTGIPAGDFALVDWPGMLTRSVATLAAVFVVAATVAYRRGTAGVCSSCGRPLTRPGRAVAWPGYAAAALALVYPLVKFYWWAGGAFGRPGDYVSTFPTAETVALIGGVTISLAMVLPFGRVFPRWVPLLGGRRVPRWMPLSVGWVVTLVLLAQGLIPLFALVNYLLGGPPLPMDVGSANSWVITIVYGSWALFGAALGAATVLYQQQTRRGCPQCTPAPSDTRADPAAAGDQLTTAPAARSGTAASG